jgi:hypothetical protein
MLIYNREVIDSNPNWATVLVREERLYDYGYGPRIRQNSLV